MAEAVRATCNWPINPPRDVRDEVAEASDDTLSPFHVIVRIVGGAMTVSLALVLRSPRRASWVPDIVAFRTRYGPPIRMEVLVPRPQ